jgi:hypothetical protein
MYTNKNHNMSADKLLRINTGKNEENVRYMGIYKQIQ